MTFLAEDKSPPYYSLDALVMYLGWLFLHHKKRDARGKKLDEGE